MDLEGSRAENHLPGAPRVSTPTDPSRTSTSRGDSPVSDERDRTLRFLTFGLVVGSAAVLATYWLPLVLAAWAADLLRPAIRALQRLLGGRRRGAVAIVVLAVVAVLVPISAALVSLVGSLQELATQVRAAIEGSGSVGGILLGGGPAGAHPSLRDWAELGGRYGVGAWRALLVLLRTSSTVLLQALVFAASLLAFAEWGSRVYRWLARHAPLPPTALRRLAGAFAETGRGLVIGGGGTALTQGLVMTVAYSALGIPRAFVLGLLTAVCAVVPAVGTALVWLPLAAELAITGDYLRAGILFAVGAVNSVVDNLLRPVLTRYGRLNLPTVLVLVSILGGIALLGAGGAVLGPLLLRLSREALAIRRERRERTHQLSAPLAR